MPRSRQLPRSLRKRLIEVTGGLDEAAERAALGVYQATSPTEFYDAERAVAQDARRRADEVVAAVLEFRADEASSIKPAKEQAHGKAKAAGIKVKSHGAHPTPVRLLGGTEIRLRTLVLQPVAAPGPGRKRGVGRRGKTGSGVRPLLDQLGIVGKATPALVADVAREMTEAASYEVALSSMRERGLDISKQVAMRLLYLFADRAVALRDERVGQAAGEPAPETGELAGRRIVVSVDGGRSRIRQNATAGRRNAKTRHRKFKTPWKEPRVMSVYVLDDEGNRDPSAQVFLDGTMGDAEATLALMVGHLRLLGAHLAEQVVLVADGAEWIWERAHRLRQAVGIEPERWTEVLDWYHAVEHLHGVAAIPKDWKDDERKAWIRRAKRHLHLGRVDQVLEDIDTLRVGRRAKEIAKGARYFVNNADRMRYADFRAAAVPSGSGGVESAVRRVINQRMKGNSRFWLPERAEGMLHLRSHLKAGRWDQLVRQTICQPVWPPAEAHARPAG